METLKAIIVMIMVAATMFRCVSSEATNHTVGGPNGWTLVSNLQAWSASTTFHAGDFLVFRYAPVHDVLEVTPLDFATCRSINPIRAYNDGETVIELTQPGTRYFICGTRGHCAMGLKVSIQVLPAQLTTANTTTSNTTTTPSPQRSRGRHPPPPPRRPPRPPHHPPPPPPPHGSQPELSCPPCPPTSGAGESIVGLELWWVYLITLLI